MMRRHDSHGRLDWRTALFACGLAFLMTLQILAAPVMRAHAGSADSGAVYSLAAISPDCHSDVGDPSGKSERGHHDCCILCQTLTRDAAIVFVWATVVLTVDLTREAQAVFYAEPKTARPRAVGWASSWSSRAPPFFS
jgi:hypothetical protein